MKSPIGDVGSEIVNACDLVENRIRYNLIKLPIAYFRIYKDTSILGDTQSKIHGVSSRT